MTQGHALSLDSTLSRRPRKPAWSLAAVPAAFVILALAGFALAPAAADVYYRSVLVGATALAGGSALLTTRRFAAGDKLFLSWAALGAGYLLSAIRHGFRLAAITAGTAMPPQPLLDGMMIVQNVLVALALLWFVLAWRSTGLATPLSRGGEILSIAGGIAIALAAGGYPLLRGWGEAATNPAILISTGGDIVGLALIVPLMLSALAMRGGMLMHTWLALALSELAWLGYDVWTAAAPSVAMAPTAERGVTEIFRLLAVSFALAATIAQRRATR